MKYIHLSFLIIATLLGSLPRETYSAPTEEKQILTDELKENSQKAFGSLLFIARSIDKKEDISTSLGSSFAFPISPDEKETIKKLMTTVHSEKVFKQASGAYLFAFNKGSSNSMDYYYVVKTPNSFCCLIATVKEIQQNQYLHAITTSKDLTTIKKFSERYGFGGVLQFRPFSY